MRRLASVIAGPAFGGAHNQLVKLAGPLRERGIETTAVVPDDADGPAQRIAAAGVDVVRIPMRRPRATANPATHVRWMGALRRDVTTLRGVLRELGADLVQVHGPTNPQAALAARREGGIGIVWQLLDTRAPMPVRRAAMPLVTRVGDTITAWGRALIDAHPGAARLGERALVVYPPVDTGEFAPRPDRRDDARRELGVSGDGPVIGSVGVLNPQKGHEQLIRAHALLPPALGAQLRILGAPSPAHEAYRRRLLATASAAGSPDPGSLFADPGERVPQLLAGLDVFVLASRPRSEGMPTAILEAMASGIAVVASDVGAVRELVEDGRSGLLVPPDDPAALAAAIGTLLSDPGRRERFGSRGRELAEREFGIDRLAGIHCDAYRLAIEHRAARSR